MGRTCSQPIVSLINSVPMCAASEIERRDFAKHLTQHGDALLEWLAARHFKEATTVSRRSQPLPFEM